MTREKNEISNSIGNNKFEVLLFSMGSSEVFGMNVFKIREITQTPLITKTPHVHPGIAGVVSIRGNIIPVLNLSFFLDSHQEVDQLGTMMITEFSGRTQAFLVKNVDRIVRLNWEDVKAPHHILGETNGVVTSITQLDDGRLVSIIDAEQIVVEAFGAPVLGDLKPLEVSRETTVFYVDDSAVARKEIQMVLDKIGVQSLSAANGKEAWEKLQILAQDPSSLDKIKIILTDVEMPEMDGFVLTKHIKNHDKLKHIPVVMHSSLSSEANRNMGKSAGVDDYVAKFNQEALSQAIARQIVGK